MKIVLEGKQNLRPGRARLKIVQMLSVAILINQTRKNLLLHQPLRQPQVLPLRCQQTTTAASAASAS